jgi:hypothetical protein
MKIGLLNKGNWFIHKDCTYKVLSIDYTFVKAKKVHNRDDVTHYFLTSIEVEKDLIDNYQWVNPNWVISDLKKQNLD